MPAQTQLGLMNRDELAEEHRAQQANYDALRARGLSLDLTRGKPSPEQLDLANELLSLPGEGTFRDAAGTDCRNYGGLAGLPELREIFGALLNVPASNLYAAGNASLELMHDLVVYSLLHGNPDSPRPWSAEPVVRFLCPSPAP